MRALIGAGEGRYLLPIFFSSSFPRATLDLRLTDVEPVMMSPDRPKSSSSRSVFSTLDEAELSESLVYLTCPICEEERHRLPPNSPSPS